VLGLDARDELLRGDPLGLRLEHHRCAVGVVRADVGAIVAGQAHRACPDVRLYGLEDVPEVERAVGVGQGAGDEDAAHGVLQWGWSVDHYASARPSPLGSP